jgi:hypothetical protein
MDLLETWGKWTPSSSRLVLDQDDEFLSKKPNESLISGWKEYFERPEFGIRDDRSHHLALVPQPFVGDIRRASIYILLLNPGLSPSDYFGEFEVEGFRQILLNNLKQEWLENQKPFLFLDPQYSWHEGFKWWNEKLLGVIEELSKCWKVSLAIARNRLASELASVELFPYHSKSFGSANLLNKLESTKLARNFLNGYVIPRVKIGKAIVVVTRKTREWNIKERHKGIIKYKPQHARGAHLTPNSDGGNAIIEHLKNIYKK